MRRGKNELLVLLVMGAAMGTIAGSAPAEENRRGRTELQVLRKEVAALRERVAELEVRRPDTSKRAPDFRRSRKPRLELEVDGFVAAEGAFETRSTDGDRFLNLAPFDGGGDDEADSLFSARATRLGLSIRAPEGPLGLSARGRLEVDFDTDDAAPRIRHAYVSILDAPDEPTWELLFGQTWAVATQLNPETVNNDNLFNLGNAYERVPQIRLSRHFDVQGGEVLLEAGLLRFFGAFDQGSAFGIPLALQQPDGDSYEIRSSALPLGQLRVAWHPAGNSAYLAVSASGGEFRVEDAADQEETVDHWLVAAEFRLPAWRTFQLSGEAFWGRAPGFNAGVGQSVVVTSSGDVRAVESRGGFVQLAVRPHDRVHCHLVYGIDDPENRVADVRLSVPRNQTALGNCFWRLHPALDLALEVQGVRTEWQVQGDAFEADDLRVTPALYLRF